MFRGYGCPMSSAAPKLPLAPTDNSEAAALARGEALMRQLLNDGWTMEEILDDTPTDVTPEEVSAWLLGNAPCPWPRST